MLKSSRASRISPKVRRSTANGSPLCPIEEDESMAVFSWARIMVEAGHEPRLKLLRCGFEGLRLPMGLRMKVKRQSVSKAWPDLFLAVPRMSFGLRHTCNDFMGLFIELKRRKGGVLSQEQKDMHALLMQQGYEVCVCRGADDAIATIKQYLGIKEAKCHTSEPTLKTFTER